MEQIVRVKEVYPDGSAQVIHVRESACSGDCHKCSGCGAAKETLLFTALNPIRATKGDLVVVKSESGPVLKAAAVLYVMPLLLFFLGYAAAEALQLSGGLGGALGFILGVALVIVYDRHFAKTVKTVYTITGYAGDALLESMKKGDNELG